MKTNRDQYPLHGVAVHYLPIRGQTVCHAAWMDARARQSAPGRTWPWALACLLLACAGTAMAVMP